MSPETCVAHSPRGDLAITLSGGGARAAYQVGVLRGLARHLPRARPVILTGESAGAINVAYLAAYPGALPEAIENLASLWNQLTADQLFRIGPLSLAYNVLRWGTRLISGGAAIAPKVRAPLGPVPSGPLRDRNPLTGRCPRCARGRSHPSTSPGAAWRGRNFREGAFVSLSLTRCRW